MVKTENLDDIEIKDEIIYFKGKKTKFHWDELINTAYWAKTDLSAHSFYSTPLLHFDRDKERGRPFAYYSYGTSITEVTLDCIRGTYTVDEISVVHDIGESLNPGIDKGQFEGGILQCVGWTTIESIIYDESGVLQSTASSYKVPDIKFIPEKFNINFLEDAKNPFAVGNSKAVGEPPFVHGLGTYFAILKALNAAVEGEGKNIPALPITTERAFMYLYD